MKPQFKNNQWEAGEVPEKPIKGYYDNLDPYDQSNKEGWEKSWQEVNAQLPNGVNPHAYRLGWLDSRKQLQARITELETILNSKN